MPGTTDSYCERCGARYVFSSNAPKGPSVKGARVLAKGLRNFVFTDGQSMADSLAQARHEDDHEDSSRMTEAFHRTFNFCMTCRQYACDRCWNARAGTCYSCAPEPGAAREEPRDRFLPGTPAPRWDPDWSLFQETAAAQAETRPEPPAPFDAPIHLVEPPPTLAPEPPPASVWPADLPTDVPAAASGPTSRSSHRSRKAVDQTAASLWPTTDELAPDMALTKEELHAVKSGLGRGEAVPYPSQGQASTSEPPEAPRSVGREPESGVPQRRILSMPLAESSLPPLAPSAPAAPAHEHAPLVARLLGRREPQAEGQGPTRRRAPSSGRGGEAAEPWPRATAWSDRPVEAHDWWGDNSAETAASSPTRSRQFEEPIEAAAPGPADPAPELPLGQHSDLGAQTTILERLSAVAASAASPGTPGDEQDTGAAFSWGEPTVEREPVQPATQPPTAKAADAQAAAQPPSFYLAAAAQAHNAPPPERPAWPRADREVAESAGIRSEPSEQAGQPAERRGTSPWPPLGASWPSQESPDAPWPAPETSPVPAALAGQEAKPQTVAEMWAQSSQEVINRGSVRVCQNCSLPVSTQARYCRRCGTRQV